MKKIFLALIALCLSACLCLCFTSCENSGEQDKSKTPSRRQPTDLSQYSSVIVSTSEIKIVGETVVHEFYEYGDTTKIVFTYKDGRLDNAVFKRVCRDKESANTVYNTFTALNEHASSPMYEDLKLDGLTFSCKYTDFIMQDYKNLSQTELKEYLENEALLP